MAQDFDVPTLRLAASRPRLVLGTLGIGVLATIVLNIAVSGTFGLLLRLGLIGFAALVLLLAWRLWQAGAITLEFDGTVLRETGGHGRVLARLSDIEGLDRGAFAFKPSNGFLIRLATAGEAAWVPGLWWRRGRLVGVGGLLRANEAKFLAEAIALRLAEGEMRS